MHAVSFCSSLPNGSNKVSHPRADGDCDADVNPQDRALGSISERLWRG